MRTVVAALGGIVILFVGVFAMSESAQQAQPALNTTAANESYAAAEQVFGGVAGSGGQAVVWGGIAAVVLIGLGFLLMAGRSGR
jgi:hypothetical protein